MEWIEQDIIELLDNRLDAVEQAILAIYARQTATEQDTGRTIELNYIGFNSYDASLGTYLATYLQESDRNHLSGKFVAKARHLIKKYRRQLAEIANESELRKVA